MKEEPYLGDVIEYTCITSLRSDVYELVSLERGIMSDRTNLVLQFDISFNDLDVDSRVQVNEKTGTCAVILLQSSMKLPELLQHLIM